MTALVTNNFHYLFGLHSNIPECCARYYQDKVDEGMEHIGSTCRPEYIDKHWDISYVVCDECDNKVKSGTYVPNKVHLCHRDPNDDCKQFIES